MTAIAFDFDGTLVDTMPQLTGIATDLISTFFHHTRFNAKTMYLSTIGRPFEEQIEILFPGESEATKDLVVRLYNYERITQVYTKDISIMPYAASVMSVLKNRGVYLYVCSSTPRGMFSDFLEKHFLPGAFSLMKGESKREQLQRIKNFFHDDVYFVGDAKYDHELADELGITFIDANDGMLQVLTAVKS
jgi:phosphoglycolate phosphatase-like HAD superfamily hydrolase